MRITRQDMLALIIIFLAVAFFFRPLFYPKPQMFITPEMGVSDIWQLNFPLKVFLQESIRSGQLPLWNKGMGGGFPLIAEAQIGAFFIPNLLLFYYLPSYQAFNLSYVVTFLTVSFSMYFLGRHFKLSVPASILASITFSFSGFFIAHISHLNVIQAAAFLPLIFLLSDLILTGKSKKWTVAIIVLYSIILSQQIFAGFPQMVFLTLFPVFFYIVYLAIIKFRAKELLSLLKPFLLLIAAITLGFFLSAIQLLPTFELTNLSLRSGGLNSQEVLQYSFKPELFKTFINPWAAGSPKDGSYPDYTKFDGAIFWENIGYVGILPLILVIFALFNLRKNKFVLFFFILLFLSILLMLGKNSPLYVLLLFPPISFFRIHSRFILLVIMSLSLLSAFGLDYFLNILRRKVVVIFFIGLSAVFITYIDIMKVWFNYHALADVQIWLSEPETVQYLKSVDHGKFFSLNRFSLWRYYFLTFGWTKPLDYISARNGLHPNLNILYNLPSAEIYTALFTKRLLYFSGLIQSGLEIRQIATSIASPSARLLSANNITHIIATDDFKTEGFTKVFETKEHVFNFSNLSIFKNENAIGRAYFTNNYKTADILSEAFDILLDNSFEPGNMVVLEKDVDIKKVNSTDQKEAIIKITKDEHQTLSLAIDAPYKGLIVVSDSYYPGWKAYIDNQEKEILAANINQRAVIVPKGKHEVVFRFESETFQKGKTISFISLIIIVILTLFQLRSFSHQRVSDNIHSSGYRNNIAGKRKRVARKLQPRKD